MPGYEPPSATGLGQLTWVVPTKADAQRATIALLESLDGPGAPPSLWEKELARSPVSPPSVMPPLGPGVEEEGGAGPGAGPGADRSAAHHIHAAQHAEAYCRAGAPGLLAPGRARGIRQASFRSNFVGMEARSAVEVVEVRDGWLRFDPQPDDTRECWVRDRADDGVWEVAAAQVILN